MILDDKDIQDATVLKLVSKLLRKNQSTRGFRLKTKRGERTLTYNEVIQFVDELATRLGDGRYGVIRRCDTCGNFSRPGNPKSKGYCFPKTHTSFRAKTDFCSRWTPMDANQKYIKEKIDEFESLQTK